MNVEVGTVTRIDRASRSLHARFDGYSPSEESPHGYLREPYPFAPAAFTPNEAGELVCIGTLGRPELIVSDHFTHVADGAVVQGDTAWFRGLTGGAGTVISQPGVGAGVARVRNADGNGTILSKSTGWILVPNNAAGSSPLTGSLHMTARVRGNPQTGPLGGGFVDSIGVGFGTFSAYVALEAFPAAVTDSWSFIVSDLSVSRRTEVAGSTFTIDQWYDVDLLLRGDSAAAGVDGNPLTVFDGALFPADSNIFALVDNVVNGNVRYIDVDRIVVTYLDVDDWNPATISLGSTGAAA